MIVDHSNIDYVRSLVRKRRKTLGIRAQNSAASELLQQLKANHAFNNARHIACYSAVDGELSCQLVIKYLWRAGKHCYLPVIDFNTEPKTMVFREYRPGDTLIRNRYGIAEPIAGKRCNNEGLDLVLTPLMAFDVCNNRIGMGGGFYDRAFGNVQKPLLIGTAYRFQRVKQIIPQPWDVGLDAVIAV